MEQSQTKAFHADLHNFMIFFLLVTHGAQGTWSCPGVKWLRAGR